MDIPALAPDECVDMRDVRRGVDQIDEALIGLLKQRFAYMDAAARIKKDRNIVRDEARKAQVIINAREAALKAGIPVSPIAQMWECLVEASIEYELKAWDRLNTNPA
jgi:isochorismate pyruvate lyase